MPEATILHDAGAFPIPHTPSGADVAAGEVIVAGEWVGIAVHSIADGSPGTLTCGVVAELPKDTGANTDFAQGAPLWWDASNNYVSETQSTHKFAGFATRATTTSEATCTVYMRGPDYNTDVS